MVVIVLIYYDIIFCVVELRKYRQSIFTYRLELVSIHKCKDKLKVLIKAP